MRMTEEQIRNAAPSVKREDLTGSSSISRQELDDVSKLVSRRGKLAKLKTFRHGDKVRIINPYPYMSWTYRDNRAVNTESRAPNSIYFDREYENFVTLVCVYDRFSWTETISKNVMLGSNIDIVKEDY